MTHRKTKTTISMVLLSLLLAYNTEAKAKHHKKLKGPKIADKVPHEITNEIACLANNILREAGGESTLGQKAVASVTMNRVLSKKFPKTICGVVHQRGQFSWVGRKAFLKYSNIPTSIKTIAASYVHNYEKSQDVTKGSLYFNSSKRSKWTYEKTLRIGGHQFYRDNTMIVYENAPRGHKVVEADP